jgi:hypothetical protein
MGLERDEDHDELEEGDMSNLNKIKEKFLPPLQMSMKKL